MRMFTLAGCVELGCSPLLKKTMASSRDDDQARRLCQEDERNEMVHTYSRVERLPPEGGATGAGSMMRRFWASMAVVTAAAVLLAAQPQYGDAVRGFIKIDAPVIALTNARVIDGTGAPARANQTVILKGGNVEAIGDSSRLTPPAGATTLDLSGKSVIPGLVMVHEHLYYPAGPGVYGQLGESFIRLYLAGGVTTMRTGGNVNGFMDLKLKRLIDAGQKAGPAIDATAPDL